MADKTYMLRKDAAGIDATLNNSLRYDIEQNLSAQEKARILTTLGIDASKLNFAILGYFDTFEELEAAITTPEPGDAYGVGMAYPYDIYIWDYLRGRWINNGPIRGADGEDGKDAELSAESITAALGYVPANADEPVGFDKLKRNAKTLAFENIIIPDWAWEEVGVSQGYPWRAVIDLPGSGVDASYEPTVVFDEESLSTSELGNFCTSFDGGVFVYAARAPETLIEVLTLTCEPTLVEPLESSVFGTIVVTYGAGKTLICTDGTTTLTAKTTSGRWTFAIPYAGQWTVSNGENSQTVNITTQGQNVSVLLSEPLVPAEYQAVEYIQSSGTQYINTELAPASQDLAANIDMEFVSLPSDGVILGMRNTVSDNDRRFFAGYENGWYMGAASVFASGNQATVGTRYIVDSVISAAKTSLIVNGQNFINASGNISATFTKPFYLFCANLAGGASLFTSIKLYRASISITGEIMRDFVPCYRKSDSVAGLYDKVSNTFFTNAGSGSFVVGANI